MTKRVSVCAVPFEMTIVEGGVLFSNKSGFHGLSARFVWEYRSHLWYLTDFQGTYNKVAGAHLTRMHQLLCEHIGKDHEEFPLTFK